MKEQSILIGFHADCTDGYTAAWVTYNACKNLGASIVDIMPMTYGKDSSITTESEDKLIAKLHEGLYTSVYIVDFSLSLFCIKHLQQHYSNKRIHILDHHKTAFERYFPEEYVDSLSCVAETRHNVHIILDNNESGASMCWRYFNSADTPPPVLVNYVKDYDLWRFVQGDNTRYVNKVLKAADKTIENFDLLAATMETETGLESILADGREMQVRHDKVVAAIAEVAKPINIAGYKGLAVQCSYLYVSDVGHLLAKKTGTFGAMYTIDENTWNIKWSLRSEEGGLDVSHIAKQFGGGGHKGAAGFTQSILPITPETY